MSRLADFIRDGCSTSASDRCFALGELAMLEARIEALYYKLRQYGKHLPGCWLETGPFDIGEDHGCTCGFDAALAEEEKKR